MQGESAVLQLSFLGGLSSHKAGNATLQASIQGGIATAQVSFQGATATLQFSLQGTNAALLVLHY